MEAVFFPFRLTAIWISASARNVQEGGEVRRRDILALSQTSPSEAASLREQTGLLTGTLASLPASEAEVLWLHHAEGLSFSTISERLGLSRKRIRVIWATRAAIGEAVDGRTGDLRPSIMKYGVAHETRLRRDPGP